MTDSTEVLVRAAVQQKIYKKKADMGIRNHVPGAAKKSKKKTAKRQTQGDLN